MSEPRTRAGWLFRLLLPLVATWLLPAVAPAQTLLDSYVDGLSTWSADFTETKQDERGRRIEQRTGQLTIVRPGKFRWETSPARGQPPDQLMIADGLNLWLLDHDLEQATVKPQGEELGHSPVMLLAGANDLRTLFAVTADGRRDSHEWVKVTPKQAESDFREAQFGFRGRELSRLVFIDKLGERSALEFSNVRRNAAVDPRLLRFETPAGVDLLGTPVEP